MWFYTYAYEVRTIAFHMVVDLHNLINIAKFAKWYMAFRFRLIQSHFGFVKKLHPVYSLQFCAKNKGLFVTLTSLRLKIF